MSSINFSDILGMVENASNDQDFATAISMVAGLEKATAQQVNTIIEAALPSCVAALSSRKSLARLSLLTHACMKSKNARLLRALAEIPAYLGIDSCIGYDKKQAIFYFSDSLTFDNVYNKIAMPEKPFFTWLADQKKSRKAPALTEDKAGAAIISLYRALRAAPIIGQSAKFAPVYAALETWTRENDPSTIAALEIEELLAN